MPITYLGLLTLGKSDLSAGKGARSDPHLIAAVELERSISATPLRKRIDGFAMGYGRAFVGGTKPFWSACRYRSHRCRRGMWRWRWTCLPSTTRRLQGGRRRRRVYLSRPFKWIKAGLEPAANPHRRATGCGIELHHQACTLWRGGCAVAWRRDGGGNDYRDRVDVPPRGSAEANSIAGNSPGVSGCDANE